MAIQLYVNSSDHSTRSVLGTINLSWVLGARVTGSLTYNINFLGVLSRPLIGQSCEVHVNSNPIFGGIFDQFTIKDPTGTGETLFYESLLIGWEYRYDKKVQNAVAFGREPVTVNAISDTLTFVDSNPFQNGYAVRIRSTGTVPAPLSTNTTYYVVNSTGTTCKLSATSGGSAINLTSDGTGDIHLVWCAGSVFKLFGAQEGLTLGTIRDGSAIELATFVWPKYSDIFNTLAELSGYVWYVTAGKQLMFVPRTEFAAPFNIAAGQADVLMKSLQVRHTNEEYGNRIHLRISESAFADTSVNFTGDGAKRKFRLATVIKSVTSIGRSSTGVEQTFGILGVDTGKDWYVEEGGYWIFQDVGGTVVGSGETLSVTYRAHGFDVPITVIEDAAEQTARATIEGGTTGVYDLVFQDDGIFSATAGEAAANALLTRHKQVPVEVTYQTRTNGVLPGQLQNINLPFYELNSDFLITEVSAREEKLGGGAFRYTVKAISTTRLGTFLDAFRAFLVGSGGGGGAASGGGSAGGGTSSNTTAIIGLTDGPGTTTITVAVVTGAWLAVKITQAPTTPRQIAWSSDFDATTPVDIPMTTNAVVTMVFAEISGKWQHLAAAVQS